MSLSTVPDLYSPNVDEFGSYTDHIPSFTNGIKCPCGSRKDKFFSSSANFASHQKTKFHQSWLSSLNLNRANYYVKSVTLEDTVRQQQIILVQMQNEIQIKSRTIDYLTEMLDDSKKIKLDLTTKSNLDLIDFN